MRHITWKYSLDHKSKMNFLLLILCDIKHTIFRQKNPFIQHKTNNTDENMQKIKINQMYNFNILNFDNRKKSYKDLI